MTGKMKSALLYGKGDIRFEVRDIPQVKDNEVLVKVMHVGICGSDVHLYKGDWGEKQPLVLGHESAGIVVEVGRNVSHLKVNDLVTVEPAIPCGKCEYCISGRYNICPTVVCMADNMDGAFSEYVAHDAAFVYKLPNGMDTIDGAMIEPLAVSMHAVERSGARLGHSAVVMGAGCIGLLTLLSLKAMGITEIYVTDLIPLRLETAKRLGAKETINIQECDVREKINEWTGNQGVDLVFETAGSTDAAGMTINIVKRGGTVVMVGVITGGKVNFDFGQMMGKEAVTHAVFRYCNNYPTAIKVVSNGQIDVKSIVTNVFKFEEVSKAMEFAAVNARNSVKTIVEF